MKRTLQMLAGAGCVAALLAGCERTMHDMYEQPRYDAGEASPLFADGRADRAPPADTLAARRGILAMTSSGRRGAVPQAPAAASDVGRPDPTSAQGAPAGLAATSRAALHVLRRGRDRYDIYCVPCHSPLGDGDGLVVRRGFPRPPSLNADPLRRASDSRLFDAITSGLGAMPALGDRLDVPDRWAVVAYVRALQRSQGARADELPADWRQRLERAAPPETPR